jgi:hypothetical protein
MTHHVDHTKGRELVTGHREDVEADLFGIKATLFLENALLLSNCGLERLCPIDD